MLQSWLYLKTSPISPVWRVLGIRPTSIFSTCICPQRRHHTLLPSVSPSWSFTRRTTNYGRRSFTATTFISVHPAHFYRDASYIILCLETCPAKNWFWRRICRRCGIERAWCSMHGSRQINFRIERRQNICIEWRSASWEKDMYQIHSSTIRMGNLQ